MDHNGPCHLQLIFEIACSITIYVKRSFPVQQYMSPLPGVSESFIMISEPLNLKTAAAFNDHTHTYRNNGKNRKLCLTVVRTKIQKPSSAFACQPMLHL
jgi:hypothetical protein